MAAGEAQRLHEVVVGFVDLLAEVRGHDGAVAVVAVGVGERRVGDGHLQRVGQQISLPDREVHVVADRPRRAGFGDDVARLAVVFVLAFGFERVLFGQPLAARHDARELARQVDAGRLPDAEFVGLLLDDFAAVFVGQLADGEEVRVGGDLQRFDEPDRAVVGRARRCRTSRSRRRCILPAPRPSVGLITPASSAAIAVIGLNVEPVGYSPSSARSVSASGFVAAAARSACRIRLWSAVWRTCSGRSSDRSPSRALRR